MILSDAVLASILTAIHPPGTDVYVTLVREVEWEDREEQNWLQRLLRRPAFVAYRKTRERDPWIGRRRMNLTRRLRDGLEYLPVTFSDEHMAGTTYVGWEVENEDRTKLWWGDFPEPITISGTCPGTITLNPSIRVGT